MENIYGEPEVTLYNIKFMLDNGDIIEFSNLTEKEFKIEFKRNSL